MKNLIYQTLLLLTPISIFSQIAIEKNSIDGNSTILDFNNTAGNLKGIILPAVQNVPLFTVDPLVQSPNNGTFIFDKTSQKAKMFENNMWVDLSDAGNSTAATLNPSTENGASQGVIIGANSSQAAGVLVLESTDKAIIIPHVNTPHLNVVSPYPGMICYDTQSKSLAVYDGTNWNYWK